MLLLGVDANYQKVIIHAYNKKYYSERFSWLIPAIALVIFTMRGERNKIEIGGVIENILQNRIIETWTGNKRQKTGRF